MGIRRDRAPWYAAVEGLDAQIEAHPGTRAIRDLGDVRRSWEVYANAWTSLYALLHSGESDPDLKLSLLIARNDGREGFQKAADSALLGFGAALLALVENTRRVIRRQDKAFTDEYQDHLKQVLALEGTEFVGQLRNYVQHYKQVPWVFRGTSERDTLTCAILLETGRLVRGYDWKGARPFLAARPDGIHLRPLLERYHSAMFELYTWYGPAFSEAHIEELDGVNDLIRQRNLTATDGAFADRDDFLDMVERAAKGEETPDGPTQS